MGKKLRLYVWKEFVCDYTCGVAFALAYDVKEARKLVIKSYGYNVGDVKRDPEIYETPFGYAVSGGG